MIGCAASNFTGAIWDGSGLRLLMTPRISKFHPNTLRELPRCEQQPIAVTIAQMLVRLPLHACTLIGMQ